RGGRDWSPVFRTTSTPEVATTPDGTQRVVVRATDGSAHLDLELEVELSAQGLLRLRSTLTNVGADPYVVGAVRHTVPVPEQATELLDFTGRHTSERIPQRQPFPAGVHSREVRTGRTGLD